MKKRITSFIITILIILVFILHLSHLNIVYASGDPREPPKTETTIEEDEQTTSQGQDSSSKTTEETWVSEAFSAAKSFLKEDVKDPIGFGNSFLKIFTDIIKAINNVLIVLLFGISAISLSIIGIRYMMSSAIPAEKEKAKKNLKTAVIGMAYGFGAYTIWNIAMGLVTIIIGAF